MTVKFELGCEISEFNKYLESIGPNVSDIDIQLKRSKPEQLIVWRENDEIVGHAFWHESSTDTHREGNPRDVEDKVKLRELFGGPTDLVELHEVWLKHEHRGKGYGGQFFAFFEELMRQKQFAKIAYYAYNPAALAICRKRGYKLVGPLQLPGFEGNVEATYVIGIFL